MKKKKVFVFIITASVMAVLCSITVFADGEVANAVSNTWTKARGQIKSIVNDVVFPVIDVVLAILLFAKWAAQAILFGCLIFSLTAPLYLWSIVGM